ncbi:MAG TPA: hypothetical protein VKU00_03745 [Chthonomonadaceae bacterium]|nr:hypothetical protein [Chthonomonadaceae bacterium]
MKKQIHPGVAGAILGGALILVLFFYYKQTETPPPMPMSPLGPGVAAMRRAGGGMGQFMSPAEKLMMSRSGRNVSAAPAGLPGGKGAGSPAGQASGK